MSARQKTVVGVALALPLALVAVVVVLATVLGRQGGGDGGSGGGGGGPLALADVPTPAASSPECGQLFTALPTDLRSGGQRLPRRRLAPPAPPGALAWGGAHADSGQLSGQPVVLRCGVQRPLSLTLTSQLVVISGVQWLQQPGQGASTWVAVDRPVYVALTLPDGVGSGAIQETSMAITTTLPARPVDLGEGVG